MANDLAQRLDPVVLHRQDSDQIEMTRFCRGLAGIFSQRSPAKSTPNEDAAALLPWNDEAGVLVVADGVGGARSGDEAAKTAVDALRKTIASVTEASQLRPAILDGLERANQQILQDLAGAATTIVVVEVQGTSIRPYHVGDSVVILVGNHGKVKYQTMSHSPVGLAQRAGWIDESEALHHEQRHYVSNFLGSPEMRIELGSSMQMSPRDTVLLATDGVFDNLHQSELVELIRRGPLQRCLLNLARLVHERMVQPQEGLPSKSDDATFIGFRQGKLPG